MIILDDDKLYKYKYLIIFMATLKSIVGKICIATGALSLVGLFGISVYHEVKPEYQRSSFEDSSNNSKPLSEAYSFSSWGELERTRWNEGYTDPNIELGDLDGDGDLDMIVASDRNVIIYENKIPQKK